MIVKLYAECILAKVIDCSRTRAGGLTSQRKKYESIKLLVECSSKWDAKKPAAERKASHYTLNFSEKRGRFY